MKLWPMTWGTEGLPLSNSGLINLVFNDPIYSFSKHLWTLTSGFCTRISQRDQKDSCFHPRGDTNRQLRGRRHRVAVFHTHETPLGIPLCPGKAELREPESPVRRPTASRAYRRRATSSRPHGSGSIWRHRGGRRRREAA